MLKPSQPIGQQVYDFVLENILFGHFAPAERITENNIADRLNVSRMPVRDAFKRLEQDGILERLPQRGMRVTIVTAELVKEVFGIRRLLEPFAVELACENRDQSHIIEMHFIEARAKKILQNPEAISPENHKELFDLNTRFHDVICQASKSRYLMRLLSNMRHAVLRLRWMGMLRAETQQSVWEEHGKLLECVKNKDIKSVGYIMRGHIDKAAEHTIAGIESELKQEA